LHNTARYLKRFRWRHFVSIHFSRSTRSLHADGFRTTLVVLILAILLLMVWAVWFFLTKTTLYETGNVVSVEKDGTIIADFSPEAFGRIQAGQLAILHINQTSNDRAGSLPAVVTDVPHIPPQEQFRVTLYPRPRRGAESASGERRQLMSPIRTYSDALVALEDDSAVQVEVEVERVSPAVLAMRTSGQFIDTAAVSLNPRNKLREAGR
jgi:hypothetical protein